ncbi:MAG: metallophosphoesterase [Verrucomicrobia bacterium]|nr:metallophosphoesterase [Verrucomicrobiota bacterium]
MTIWALSDPHLAFGAPSKSMEVFGPDWKDYAEKIATHWKQQIAPSDLVLIPGDISWAMKLEEALIDLKWIDALPGTKLLIRGNHDYWWSSKAKMTPLLPPTIHCLHNDAFVWNEVAIGGSRLWDTQEYNFNTYITFQENPRARMKTPEELLKEKEEDERIFARELERLKLSLSQLKKECKTQIAMTHYPPIGADLAPSKASAILEAHQIDICVFGHLHNVKKGSLPFGEARGVKYLFTSCDYLDFIPLRVCP